MINYLQKPSAKVEFKLKEKALKYIMIGDDLNVRSSNGVLLRCINQIESIRLMGEVYEGLCGSHRSETIIKWLLIWREYY